MVGPGRAASEEAAGRFDPAEVRRYYDRHTSVFVRFGQGGDAGALHRAVWGPGIADRQTAFHYVDDRIVELVRRLRPAAENVHVVDLGCGVGASLCYLAARVPIRGTGITLSPVQARLASARVEAAGLSARVACIEGDYCAIPPGVAPADLAYAIESFAHGPAPERFLAECGRLVRPGGLLVICDDMRRATTDPAAARAIARFRRGWRVNTLLHREELQALARRAGFEHVSTSDLTPFLEIHRLRDRVIQAMVALFGWLPLEATRFGPLLGGSALQTCLARGWIGYDLVVFRRAG